MQNDMTDKQTWHAEAMRLVDELVGVAARESITACKGGFERAREALSAHLASMAAPGADAEDVARLDWLEQQQDVTWQTHRGQWSGTDGGTLRQIIDATMAKETK